MNKITVVKEKILTELNQMNSGIIYENNSLFITKDTTLLLDFDNSKVDLKIVIDSNVVVKLISKNIQSSNKICFKLKSSSYLEAFHIGYNCNDDISVFLEEENAKVNYRYSTINDNKSNNYKLSIYHTSSNTQSNVINHGVNFSKEILSFDINGSVSKESSNCICNQDNKIIGLFDNSARIDPNLFIDNHDVEASHAAFIGRFNADELFYLMSRGISKDKCYRLLLEGFLLGKENIDKNLKEWFFSYLKNRR